MLVSRAPSGGQHDSTSRVNTSFVDQATEVVDITCQHRVAVSGKQRDMGVDDICCLGCPAEVAGSA